MSSHQELADFIKSVHINLRLRSRDIGPSAAWSEHCANKEILEKYAYAMQELASNHWEKNNGESSELSRIYWVMKQIEFYFKKGGRLNFFNKEKKLAQKFGCEYNCENSEFINFNVISLLDVGSCYNPFLKFPDINVTAIDLAPACSDVLMCDFLKVTVGTKIVTHPPNICNELPTENYDVVLFSLLLEYMPSPKQRFVCCQKASMLLKIGGILIILTPDSKHATANSKLIKDWRLAMASLGLLLHHSEKLKHLRCLVFAKCSNPDISNKWLIAQKSPVSVEEALVIPQDNNPYDYINKSFHSTEETSKNQELDNNFLTEAFCHIMDEGDNLFM